MLIEGRLIGSASNLILIESELVGSFRANAKSRLALDDTDQTNNPDGNQLNSDSLLHMFRGSTSLGETQFRTFSTGVLRGDTTHDGDLVCTDGSDVACAFSAMITGTSNCLQCLPPISLILFTPQPGPQCGDVTINGVTDANIVRIVWIWGDDITESFFEAAHSYSQNGVYTVQVTAHSDNGATETETTFVTIDCF